MVKPAILCVDDEVDNVEALERLFRNQYTVLKATSGAQAIKLLKNQNESISVILTDQRMPEMTGVEFLQESIKIQPDAIRILLTGYTDMESIVAAVNSGHIYRYLNKPWDPVDLINTVKNAVEKFNLANEIKQKNIELAKALDELKILDKAKTQFMILINHELKTPLTSLLNFTELLKETKLDEEQKICVERLEKSGDRLKDLIHDSLLVVSAETKTLSYKMLPFDSSALDLKLKPEIDKRAEQKQLQISKEFSTQKLIADSSLVAQILRRLLHNAIKFSKESTEIKLGWDQISPHRIVVFIENEGPQIPNSVLKRILEPFYLDEDVMKHSTGVGLGLTVCHALLKLQSSQLKIENTSQGVRVGFELAAL